MGWACSNCCAYSAQEKTEGDPNRPHSLHVWRRHVSPAAATSLISPTPRGPSPPDAVPCDPSDCRRTLQQNARRRKCAPIKLDKRTAAERTWGKRIKNALYAERLRRLSTSNCWPSIGVFSSGQGGSIVGLPVWLSIHPFAPFSSRYCRSFFSPAVPRPFKRDLRPASNIETVLLLLLPLRPLKNPHRTRASSADRKLILLLHG